MIKPTFKLKEVHYAVRFNIDLMKQHNITLVAVGNATKGRLSNG